MKKHLVCHRTLRRFRVPSAPVLKLAVLFGLGAALAPSARAATYTWDGGTNSDNNVDFGFNWLGNNPPPEDGSADVIFTDSAFTAGHADVTPNLDINFLVNSLTFAGGSSFTLGSTNSRGLDIGVGGLNQNSTAAQTITVPTFLTTNDQTWTFAANAGALNFSGNGQINVQGFALTLAPKGNNSLNGNISGDGALAVNGPGTITITGTNSYLGGTTISAGTLTVGTGGTSGNLGTGSVTDNGALVFDRSDNISVSNAISGSGSLIHAGTGTLTLTAANTYTGTTTISAGTLQVGAGGTSGSLGMGSVTNGSVTDNGALVFDRSDNISVSNAIGGSGSLSQNGTGTLTLTAANTYAGATTVSAGALTVGTGGSIHSMGSLRVGSDSGNAGPADFTLSALSSLSTGQTTIGGIGATTFTQNGGSFTISGILFMGGNTPQASNATYNLNGGTLTTEGVFGNQGTSTFNFNGGTLQASQDNSFFYASKQSAVQAGGAIIDTQSYNVTAKSALSSGTASNTADGGLTKLGSGTLTLEAPNSYSGTTTIMAGTLAITGSVTGGNTSVAAGAALVLSGTGSITGDEVLKVSGTSANPASVNFSGTGTLVTAETDILNSTFTQSGGSLTTGSFLYVDSGGSFTLSGAGSVTAFQVVLGAYGGGTFTQNGGTVTADFINFGLVGGSSNSTYNLNGGTLTTFGVLVSNGTAAFNFNGGTLRAIDDNSSFLQGQITANVRSGGAILDTNGYNVTVAQNLLHDTTSGASVTDGGLTKLGAGTLTLTGANTYVGGTTLAAGILNVGSAGALGTAGTLSFGGGTLQFSSANTTDYSARFNPNGNQAVSLDTNGQNVTLGTGFGGSGTSFTKQGTGTLTVNGADTYTGATVLNGGVLLANNPNALGSGGTISFGGGTLQYGDHTDAQFNSADYSARFSTAANQAYSIDTNGHGNIVYATGLTSNSGSLTKLGAGTLTLSGNNTYSGTTTIGAGTFQIGNGGTSGSLGSASVENNAVLAFNRSDATSYNGTISGVGMLIQAGTGTLTLGGSNTYTGGTTISEGSVVEASNGALGTGDVSISSSALRLTIAAGVTSALNSQATLTLAGGGVPGVADVGSIQLNGNVVTVNTLVLGDVFYDRGTFTALTDPDYISGAGSIVVGNFSIRPIDPPIPEPGTWALLGTGTTVLMAGMIRRRCRSKLDFIQNQAA